MLINLNEFLSSEAYEKVMDVALEFDSIQIQRDTYRLLDSKEVYIKLVKLGGREVQVEGTFDVTIQIPCSRCMVEVPYTVKENFVKNFNLNVNTQDDKEDSEDGHLYVDGYNLDVDHLIHDEILVHFPLKVLCREDCKGICKSCGCDLNRNKCECDKTDIDPRMAVFQDIMKQL